MSITDGATTVVSSIRPLGRFHRCPHVADRFYLDRRGVETGQADRCRHHAFQVTEEPFRTGNGHCRTLWAVEPLGTQPTSGWSGAERGNSSRAGVGLAVALINLRNTLTCESFRTFKQENPPERTCTSRKNKKTHAQGKQTPTVSTFVGRTYGESLAPSLLECASSNVVPATNRSVLHT